MLNNEVVAKLLNVMKKIFTSLCIAVVFLGVSCGQKPQMPKKATELFESAKGAIGNVGEKIESSGAKEAAQKAIKEGSATAQKAVKEGSAVAQKAIKEGSEAVQKAYKTGLAQAQEAFSKMNADEMLAELKKMLPKDVKFIPCANLNAAKKELKELRSKADITKLKFFNLSNGLDVLDAIEFVMDIGKALNPASILFGIAIDMAPKVLTKLGFAYGIFSVPKHIIIIRMEKGDWEFAATS